MAIRLPVCVRQAGFWAIAADAPGLGFTSPVFDAQAARVSTEAIAIAARVYLIINTSRTWVIVCAKERARSFALCGDRTVEPRPGGALPHCEDVGDMLA